MQSAGPLTAFARRYLAALERFETGDALAAFFTPDVIQEEFPNRLAPNGARRDLAALLESAAKGRQILASQTYEILNSIESESQVAVEMAWSGVLAVPVGALAAGAEMRARFAVFLEFRDGRICRQRNYDCIESF